MKKYEFLKKLREILSAELPWRLVEKNIDYYKSYIEEEVKSGKSEKEVLDELGDPMLIARSIIDAAQSGADGIPGNEDDIDYKKEIFGNSDRDSVGGSYGTNGESGSRGGGFSPYQNGWTKEDGDAQGDLDSGNHGGWYVYSAGCLVPILIFLIVFMFVSFLWGILGFLRPILLPLCIILLIFWMWSRR